MNPDTYTYTYSYTYAHFCVKSLLWRCCWLAFDFVDTKPCVPIDVLLSKAGFRCPRAAEGAWLCCAGGQGQALWGVSGYPGPAVTPSFAQNHETYKSGASFQQQGHVCTFQSTPDSQKILITLLVGPPTLGKLSIPYIF